MKFLKTYLPFLYISIAQTACPFNFKALTSGTAAQNGDKDMFNNNIFYSFADKDTMMIFSAKRNNGMSFPIKPDSKGKNF